MENNNKNKTKKSKKVIEKDKTLLISDFNNSIGKVLEYYLLNEYTNLSKKIFKSKMIFIFLNLSTLIMSTCITILTMFVIGKKIGGYLIQTIFVVISLITAFISFISGIDSIFTFKKRKELYLKRIEELNNILDYIDDRYKNKPNIERIVIRVSQKLEELENNQQIQ